MSVMYLVLNEITWLNTCGIHKWGNISCGGTVFIPPTGFQRFGEEQWSCSGCSWWPDSMLRSRSACRPKWPHSDYFAHMWLRFVWFFITVQTAESHRIRFFSSSDLGYFHMWNATSVWIVTSKFMQLWRHSIDSVVTSQRYWKYQASLHKIKIWLSFYLSFNSSHTLMAYLTESA